MNIQRVCNMFFVICLAFLLTINNILTQSEVNFICKSGHLLDGIEKVCDGIRDCYDGTDEIVEFCGHTICPAGFFRCNYGACIPRLKKCNGIQDCVDSSDETNCGRKSKSCERNEFNCGYDEDDIDSYRYCIDSSKICDGIPDCSNGADENKTICMNDLCPEKSFRCGYGGCISDTVLCDGYFDCLDGTDESNELCITLKCPKCTNSMVSCPAFGENTIQSNRISKQCIWNGREMPCTQHISPGTKVTYACKDNFKPKTSKDFNNVWNLCQADATWLRDFLECIPNCGRLEAEVPSISNKLSQTRPWHASIFLDENKQTPKYICAGTLISESVIMTAAHCVWKFNVEDLRIVFGNIMTEYEDGSDLFVRHYTVARVIVHETYLDQFANFGSDIALIEMSKPVEIDEINSPVCINWNLDDITSHIKGEEMGTVIGLGTFENATIGTSLRVTRMPIISNQQCVDRQPPAFRKYVTFTNFCAGWANGTGVCNGDSGAGLTIHKSDGKHYLEGIVSVSPRKQSTDQCDPNQYTIFTKVGIYVKWIENHLKQINERYNPQLSSQT